MAQAHVFSTPTAALKVQLEEEQLVREQVIPAAQLDSANETLRKVVQTGPVDRGEYKAGWTVRQLIGSNEVQLANDAPYAGVIELGARPFRPPFAPIFEWVKRKAAALGIVALAPGKRFRGSASLTSDEDAAAKKVAWAVVNAIAKRGLPPRYVMRKQLPFAVTALEAAFKRHLIRLTGHA